MEKLNIVFIMCDDPGYDDVRCLAPKTCKIESDINRGRSTGGEEAGNDFEPIILWKSGGKRKNSGKKKNKVNQTKVT